VQCHEQPDAFQVHIDKKLYPWKLLSCQEFRADKEMEEQENKMVDTWIQQLYPVVNHTRNLEEQTWRWRSKKKQDDRYRNSTALSLQLASTQGIWRGKIERR
jgi:hypothetical protein